MILARRYVRNIHENSVDNSEWHYQGIVWNITPYSIYFMYCGSPYNIMYVDSTIHDALCEHGEYVSSPNEAGNQFKYVKL